MSHKSEKEQFEEALFNLIIEYSNLSPIDLIEKLEGMK